MTPLDAQKLLQEHAMKWGFADAVYQPAIWMREAVMTAIKAEREACAQQLYAAAEKLAPAGKRSNQVDRHVADVLARQGDAIRARGINAAPPAQGGETPHG